MTMQNAQPGPLAPRTERFTTWHNPTDQDQYVDVFYGDGQYNEKRPTRLSFPAKKDVDFSSRFDSAIQRVQCMEEDCRKRAPGWCTNPAHAGVVVGGSAPGLQRKGANYKLLETLDPHRAELEAVKAQLAASDIARKAAEGAQLIAERRRQELEAKVKHAEDEKLEAATRPATAKK